MRYSQWWTLQTFRDHGDNFKEYIFYAGNQVIIITPKKLLFHQFFLAGAVNVMANDVPVGDPCRDSLSQNFSSNGEQLLRLSITGSQKR